MQLTNSLLQLSLLLTAAASAVQAAPGGRKNGGHKSVIQLISDGFGPASETFARSFLHARDGLPWNTTLPLDRHLVGTIRTRSTDALVTDSAASATAYSCGVKSFNAAIGVDVDSKPCGTLLEAAHELGHSTALVTTSRITHATPASYAAHTPDRDDENLIAQHELGGTVLGRRVDLMWGGGRRHFQPNTTTGSSRKDSRDLIGEAQTAGWSVALNRTAFDAFQNGSAVKFPSLGLFASSHMAYERDRNATAEPSLTEMAIAALNALEKADKPFFIMIEGARIDHAAHNNDPIGHVYDILEYNRMFEAVTEWVSKRENEDILVLSTADHECGGLTLAEQRPEDSEAFYGWYPDVLFNATKTTEFLANEYAAYVKKANRTDTELRAQMVTEINQLGLSDIQDDEVDRAVLIAKNDKTGYALPVYLASLVNWRAHLGWSTTGHSGVDVNLYMHAASDKKRASYLKSALGNHENTWIGTWTAQHLGLADKMAELTTRLNNGTQHVAGAGSANRTTVIDHYHAGTKHVLPAYSPPSAKRDFGFSHAENEWIFGAQRRAQMEERSHAAAKRQALHRDL